MPTIAQLRVEPWWDREIITAELDWLGDELCRRTGAPAYSIGTKGNEVHLNGGHRSQEWILNSDWCTNTHYTVQSGLTAEQMRHIAALDRTPGSWGTAANRTRMVLETSRLITAARAGKLVGVTQIQGTLNGTSTYGQNFPSLNTTVPDSSHLDHWHLTFDRRYLHDAALMLRIVDVVTGGSREDDDVSDAYDFLVTGERPGAPSQTYTPEARYPSIPNTPVLDRIWRASIDARIASDRADAIMAKLVSLEADVAALKLGGVDVNALAAAVAAAVGKREAAADRARADELD